MISVLRAEAIKARRLHLLTLALGIGAGLSVLVLAILRSTLARAASERRAEVPWQHGVIGDSAVLAILALPSLVVLVTALVFYVEHRDNMWKQLRTTPHHLTSIYAGKFVLIQGIVMAALVSALAVGTLGWSFLPADARALIPVPDGEVRALLATVAAEVYVALLPVALVQFVLSARLPNVLHPVGIGLGLTFASLLMYGPSTGVFFPYAYPGVIVMNRFGHQALPDDAGQAPDLAYRAKDDAFGRHEGAGGDILVDAAHGNRHSALDSGATATLRWIRHPAARAGFTVRDGLSQWSAATLGSARLLVIAGVAERAGERTITNAEVTAVVDWVRDGGSLLVLTDHDPYAEALVPLARALGVELSRGIITDPAHRDARDPRSNRIVFTRADSLVATHPVTDGVHRVITYGGGAVWRAEPGTTRLLALSRTARGSDAPAALDGVPVHHRAQAIAFEYGAGRVVFAGETAVFTAQVKGDGSSIGVGEPLADNARFAANAFRWLLER